VLFLLAGFAITGALATNYRSRQMAHANAVSRAYSRAQLAVGAEESLERKYRLERGSEVRSHFNATSAAMTAALHDVIRVADAAEAQPALDALRLHGPYLESIERLFAAVDANDAIRALDIDTNEIDPPFGRIDDLVNSAAQRQDLIAADALSALRGTQRAFMVATPIVFVIGFVLLVLFSLAIRSYRRQVEGQAKHDPLTGLANRVLLHERITQALAADGERRVDTALLLLDLDRFKFVNDALGHHYGDRLLIEIGPKLASVLPASATIARLGGDEFAVLLPGQHGPHGAMVIAERITELLRQPVEIDGLSLDVEASIGIAIAPNHAKDANELIQRADIAMYTAKGTHAGVAYFDPESASHSREQLALAGQLRAAIERDELVLHYQPKLTMRDGTVHGVEALIRWCHPDRGMIPPIEFIPLAESTSLIAPLTIWVVRNALAQLRRWLDSGLTVSVAVNVSARSLTDLAFAGNIAELLREARVPAHLLEIEVTETALMADPERAREVLADLAHLGLRIAIDDFGTGYSSLAFLQTLPVNALKIDRSFVRDMTTNTSDAVIVRSVIELGRNLGLEVIAEGVEDQSTCRELADVGCPVGQGYYWSRPIPADDLEPLLRRTAPLSR
jgi:diguanylate cyclase